MNSADDRRRISRIEHAGRSAFAKRRRTPAVDDVSLDIARGEFFALLGPVGLRQDDACCACWPGSSGRTRAAS